MKKPDTRTAMQNLIDEVRQIIPFDTAETVMCADDTSCHGCSMKLLEYLSMELENWQQRMDDGEIPNFADLAKLGRSSKAVYKTLQKNKLV
jgi:hypothetical protein